MGNETRRESSFFNKKQEKRGKTGGKHQKSGEKKENYKKYKNKILARYWEMLKKKQDFDGILGNAENGNKNKNEVFLNVTIRGFKSKNKVSVQA